MPQKHTDQSTYIDAAAYALRQLQRPASALEIYKFLKSSQKFEGRFGGATPQKTIQARIATDIKKHGPNSRFFRTAPAIFALRQLSEQGKYQPAPKRVYVGFNRSRQLDNSPICSVDLKSTRFRPDTGFSDAEHIPLRFFKHLPLRYIPRKEALRKDSIIVINLFVTIVFNDQILCFEPTSYLQDNDSIRNRDTVGITGYLRQSDADLFDETGIGFRNATIREFHEFFHLLYKDSHKLIDSIRYLGTLYDDFSEERKMRLALVSLVRTKEKIETDNVKLGVKNMHWKCYKEIPNSYFRLEPWSQSIFRMMSESAFDRP